MSAGGPPSLSNAVIELGSLRDSDRKEFSSILKPLRGTRSALVLDPFLMGRLSLMIEMSFLKQNGVEKIFKLGPIPPERGFDSYVWVLRDNASLIEHVRVHIASSDTGVRNIVVFVPQRTLLAEREFDDVASKIEEICEFPMNLIPFDDDVISLEDHDCYRATRVDGDQGHLYGVAHALMRLQAMFGVIPTIYGKGAYAKQVCDILVRMRQEVLSDAAAAAAVAAGAESVDDADPVPEIGQLVILDREVDMISPLLLPMTYEAMIDNVFGINNGHIELEGQIVFPPGTEKKGQPPMPPGKKVFYNLNSNDPVFVEMRDQFVGVANKRLAAKSQSIERYIKSRPSAKDSVEALKEWVSKFAPVLAERSSCAVQSHIAADVDKRFNSVEFNDELECMQLMLAEGDDSITTYIDNCIYKNEPLTKVLKLLIIHSLTQGGYKSKQYEALKREIMHAYCYEALFTLERLERLGLLHHQDVKNYYPAVRDALNLLTLDLNLMDDHPRDINYVFGGYAPLSCRIAEAAARPGGWQSIQETLKMLPGGPAFEITQETSHVGVRPPVTLVFFVGGVCYSEISALRALSNMNTTTRSDFIVGATSIVNAEKLVGSMVETLPTPQIPSEFLEPEKDPTNPF